jgi:para-aminobenzoate synthetase component 1
MKSMPGFRVNISDKWIKQLLKWADITYPYVAYFNPNNQRHPESGFKHVLYAGESAVSLEDLASLPSALPKAGIIGYDQKNSYENLSSENPAFFTCPDSLFFLPDLTVEIQDHMALIRHSHPEAIYQQICNYDYEAYTFPFNFINIHCSHTQESYHRIFKKIQEHIIEGDIYEMNYCMAYHGTFSSIDPVTLYFDLCNISPMPFSAYFKAKGLVLVGASPERFLKKKGDVLMAQPMKGSVRRGATVQEDAHLKKSLLQSEKERAENLMIVDLMRNDLSKIAQTGKITVKELFGVYSFKQITQMISTVTCVLKDDANFGKIIASTFPMGSMTGAPKIKCMELIDQYETFKRSWFSGTLGYIDENGDFDFNVIIRSIVLDMESGKYYFGVGSAITSDANPEDEYAECQLKAQSLLRVLQHKHL